MTQYTIEWNLAEMPLEFNNYLLFMS